LELSKVGVTAEMRAAAMVAMWDCEEAEWKDSSLAEMWVRQKVVEREFC
jgi:hypothetical protein